MIQTKNYIFTVEENNSSLRVDKFLSLSISGLSRSALSSDNSEIFINGVSAKKSDTVKTGDTVELHYAEDVFVSVEPENIPLQILYEDKDILVINKEQGRVVHPGAGNVRGTIVNALAYRYGEEFIKRLTDGADEEALCRPGIVHRLDKDTSGVMVIALNPESLRILSAEFQDRETKKAYYALAEGVFTKREGFVEGLIARDSRDRKLFCMSGIYGKESKSHYYVEKQFDGYALVKVKIYTGRTHQIRVHLKSLGHPVLGDVLYNRRPARFGAESLMLHSYSLELNHPATGEKMKFIAPLPKRFDAFIDG